MARLAYAAVAGNPERVQQLTSLSNDEFEELVVPFESAFQAHMVSWTLAGKRRRYRRYTPYANSPLPTAHDRLLFLLSYLKENPTQAYHGLLFGLPQCKVNQWVHTLFPVLEVALRALGDAPARTQAALAQRVGSSLLEAEAALPAPHPTARGSEAGGDLLLEAEAALPAPHSPPPAEQAPPLFATTAPSDPSHAPPTRLNKPFTTAARKSATP